MMEPSHGDHSIGFKKKNYLSWYPRYLSDPEIDRSPPFSMIFLGLIPIACLFCIFIKQKQIQNRGDTYKEIHTSTLGGNTILYKIFLQNGNLRCFNHFLF